jgi:imidazolonepropionase-like amidohydrolase
MAGVDSVEHGAYLDERDLVEMAGRGIFLVVTYGVFQYVAALSTASSELREKAETGIAAYRKTLRGAKAHGVPVVVGGDSFHEGPVDEVRALSEAGFSSMECLKALTLNPARLCDLAHVKGSLGLGKTADMVALSANPLDDPLNVEKIMAVMKNGDVVYQTSG